MQFAIHAEIISKNSNVISITVSTMRRDVIY